MNMARCLSWRCPSMVITAFQPDPGYGSHGLHALDWRPPLYETAPMAKPNYSFEKRQREIAKKKKQDEKLAKKQSAKDLENPQAPSAPADREPSGQ